MPEILPGYVGFSKSKGFMGKAIRFGERLHGKGDVNHMFIIGRDGKVIQAEMKGVTCDAELSDMVTQAQCTLVRPPACVDLDKVVEFGEFYVGTGYGLWTDVAIAIDMVTAQWVPALRGARKDSIICSALGAEALRYGGWLHHWIDIYTPTPQMVLDALLLDGATIVK